MTVDWIAVIVRRVRVATIHGLAYTASAVLVWDGTARAQEETSDGGDEKRERRSATSREISPKYVAFEHGPLRVAVGAAVRLHVVPWLEDGSSSDRGDVADERGFSIDRAVLGIAATLIDDVEAVVSTQLIETERGVKGVLADAQLAYQPNDALAVTLGTMVPPFSRSALTSAQSLPTVERPHVVDRLRPGRRLGVMLDGRPWQGRLTYMVALMNGTAGYVDGNDDGGFMAGARIEAAVFGDPDPKELGAGGMSLAVSSYHSANGAEPRTGLSADLLIAVDRFSLVLEALGELDRSSSPQEWAYGSYAEVGCSFEAGPDHRLQVVARGELLDDERNGESGDRRVLFTAGVNLAFPNDHLRAQLQLTRRQDRDPPKDAHHGLVLALQGSF